MILARFLDSLAHHLARLLDHQLAVSALQIVVQWWVGQG
jgi:hypothetical protein